MSVILYKHSKWRDVAFEVVKRFYVREKGIMKLKVMWWNIGECHKPWPMQITERLEIPLSTFKKEYRMYQEPIIIKDRPLDIELMRAKWVHRTGGSDV